MNDCLGWKLDIKTNVQGERVNDTHVVETLSVYSSGLYFQECHQQNFERDGQATKLDQSINELTINVQ